MTKVMIIDLLIQHKYSTIWEHCKYIGHNIVPNIHTRFIVFTDVINMYDCSKNDNFIAYYKKYLNYYARNEAKKDFICPENKQLRALRMRQNISPDPSEYADMCVVRDKIKFIIGQ